MRSILNYVILMVFVSFLGTVLWLVFRLICKTYRKRKTIYNGTQREKVFLLLFIYLAGLFSLTLVPIGFWNSVFNGKIPTFPPAFRGNINLIPFRQSISLFRYYVRHKLWSVILINFPGNIIIFLPLGFFYGILSRQAVWWKSVLSAFGISLFIECFQLFVSRGTDVDDLILNTLGGLCGYGFYRLFCRVAPNLNLQCKE